MVAEACRTNPDRDLHLSVYAHSSSIAKRSAPRVAIAPWLQVVIVDDAVHILGCELWSWDVAGWMAMNSVKQADHESAQNQTVSAQHTFASAHFRTDYS